MSVDFEKLTAHIFADAREELDATQSILETGKARQAMLFAHLALEKALEVLVMRVTKETAPKIHNLPELASRTSISFDEEQMKFLAAMNFYQLAGRVDPVRATQNFRKSVGCSGNW